MISKTAETQSQLLKKVQCHMDEAGYRELANVRCRLVDGRLILEGTLSSYYLKQQAQHAAQTALGILAVENRVRVPVQPKSAGL